MGGPGPEDVFTMFTLRDISRGGGETEEGTVTVMSAPALGSEVTDHHRNIDMESC